MLEPTPSRYGDRTLKVEPYGVEPVPDVERHGLPRAQFTLWLGSNLTIADFALGFFPVSLGLSWFWTIVALGVGNLLGAWALAACAGMGPAAGVPQLMISRQLFGRWGGAVPALLNYLSTIGWFSVNNILGALGLQLLDPHWTFWQAAAVLVVVQGMLAIFGHNLIHVYERVMSVVLGILFAVISVLLMLRPSTDRVSFHYGPVPWVPFALVVAAALSYLGSWAPYASDYSRYLPSHVSSGRVRRFSFWGGLVASLWLELVGVGVARASGAAANPIQALHHVSGGFGTVAVIAVILGGTAADALNLYSNALAAGALNIRLPRWSLAVVASIIGLSLSLLGSGRFEQYYDNFLLLLGYWLSPWLGVMLVGWYGRRQARPVPVSVPALVSFAVGLAASIPFMSSVLYTGPVAHRLGGADLTFYVGFLVSAGVYGVWTRAKTSRV